jgi:hypothetical protein
MSKLLSSTSAGNEINVEEAHSSLMLSRDHQLHAYSTGRMHHKEIKTFTWQSQQR